MDNTKYTKGKWYLGLTSDVKLMSDKSIIADCNWSQRTKEEQKANALLISKAPEMLEMLIDAVNEYKAGEKVSDGWYKAVEQLIKEATEL